MQRAYRRLRKKIRQGWVRLLRCPGAPREVAGGMALGLFVAMLPAIQMPLVLLLVALLRKLGVRLSPVAALAGVWLTNPVTGGALYGLAWLVGRPVVRLFWPEAGALPVEQLGLSVSELLALGPFALQILLCLLIGGVLTGLPIAFTGYHVTLRAVARYRERVFRRRSRQSLQPALR